MSTESNQVASSSTRTRPLAGKVALVTGGSRGIGAGIVRRLAEEGAAVAFTYAGSREKAEALVSELAAADQRALALQADSGDADAVRRAVAEAARALGGLDFLVNNAGVLEAGPLADATDAALDRLLAVNVRGPVVAIQAALPLLRDGGRIVNIGSVNANHVPFPGISLYSMTKGAIMGLTHGLARELGARGITVNNVQPGPVDTDMNPAHGPNAAHLKELMAVKRYGRPSEIAGLVAYLVGPDGGYVTGADLLIDGGFAA